MATTNINIRTDSDIKAQAQAIFASLGLDMTTAVNLFLRQTVRQNDLPFVLTNLPQNKPVQAQPASREQMFGLLRDQYQCQPILMQHLMILRIICDEVVA